MVEPVAEDRVAFSRQSANRPSVGGKTRGKENRRGLPLETGQTIFKLLMPGRPAADKRAGACPHAGLVERQPGGGDDPRVVREIQVIVGGEIEKLATIDPAA